MKANQTTTTTFTRTRLVVLFAFLLLSGVGAFAQTVKTNVVIENGLASDDTVATSQNTAATNTTMNFVSWFMGTKQTLNAAPSIEVNKKAMINSGIAPSRLLIKAFLKRASNYSSTVA